MSRITGMSEALVVRADGSGASAPTGDPCPHGGFVIDDFSRIVPSSSTGGFGVATCGAIWTNGYYDGGYEPATHTMSVDGTAAITTVTMNGANGGNSWASALTLPDSMVACTREETFSFQFQFTSGNSDSGLFIPVYDWNIATTAGGPTGYTFVGAWPPAAASNDSGFFNIATNSPFYGLEVETIREDTAESQLGTSAFTIVVGTKYQCDLNLSDSTPYTPLPTFWTAAGTMQMRVYPVGSAPSAWVSAPMYPGMPGIKTISFGPGGLGTHAGTTSMRLSNLTLQIA